MFTSEVIVSVRWEKKRATSKFVLELSSQSLKTPSEAYLCYSVKFWLAVQHSFMRTAGSTVNWLGGTEIHDEKQIYKFIIIILLNNP